jgi:hypothetical protein
VHATDSSIRFVFTGRTISLLSGTVIDGYPRQIGQAQAADRVDVIRHIVSWALSIGKREA